MRRYWKLKMGIFSPAQIFVTCSMLVREESLGTKTSHIPSCLLYTHLIPLGKNTPNEGCFIRVGMSEPHTNVVYRKT